MLLHLQFLSCQGWMRDVHIQPARRTGSRSPLWAWKSVSVPIEPYDGGLVKTDQRLDMSPATLTFSCAFES